MARSSRAAVVLGGACFVLSCGSPDGGGTGTTVGGGPAGGCDERDRIGTYLLTWDERTGDCGPVDEGISRITGATSGTSPSGASQCQITDPPFLSDDRCTLTNSVACVTVDGLVLEGLGVTTQQDSGSNRITGIFDVSIRDQSTGALLCASTYDVVYVRQ